MKVIYTEHALDKLKRPDILKFKINKKLIERAVQKSSHLLRTKYSDLYTIGELDQEHILRIIYDIIDSDIKVITFHIARKGRYDEA